MPTMILPPMPASDEQSIERNRFDGFYRMKSRDFWADAEIIHEEIGPDKKCDHEFKATPGGVKCTKCHFGLIGALEVREGKLFHKGERIPL